MSMCPIELNYTKSHEWVRKDSDAVCTIGISDHAQKLLGDLVFVELPEVGQTVKAGDEIAVIESVKTAADVYAPVSGEIIAINDELASAPEQVNQDPYGIGWLYQVRMSDAQELEDLLDSDSYETAVMEG